MAPRAGGAASAAAEEPMEGLLEGFRQLHKGLSEEIQALREENRALRQDARTRGLPQGGCGGSQELAEELSSLREEIRALRQECKAGPWQPPRASPRLQGPPARSGNPAAGAGWQRSSGRFVSSLLQEAGGHSHQQGDDVGVGVVGTPGVLSHCGTRRFAHTVMEPTIEHELLFQKESAFMHDPIERLNLATMVVALASLVYFGISIDHAQDSVMWAVLEGMTVCFFAAEQTFKIVHYGATDYFKGNSSVWNVVDVVVTLVQLTEYIVNLTLGNFTAESYFKVSLFIRGLRVVLMVQEIKVMRMSVLNDLTRMLVGFLQGLPSLLWVSLLIWVVVAMQAMVFRLIVRPNDADEDLSYACRDGNETAACPVYKVIGNEFCGTVGECMFTVFRCYMGDCSKLDGTSMIPELSKHYGAKFNISYAAGMILVMLGLFNVVTAVFVHSVEEGISNEERSYKKKHEWAGNNIRRKLKKFCNYVQMNHNHNFGGKCQFQDQTWTAAQLTAIFKDPRATSILSELDIDASEYCGTDAVDTYNLYNKIRLTDVFDIDEIDGIVNAEKMLSTLAYMQGLTHMDCDVMTSLKIQQLQRSFLALEEQLVKAGARQADAAEKRPGSEADTERAPAGGAASAAVNRLEVPTEGRPKKRTKPKPDAGTQLLAVRAP